MKALKKQHLSWLSILSGIMAISLIGYIPSISELSPLKKSSHTITIITKPSMNTYYQGKNGADGMEFQLIAKFAHEFNYKLDVVLVKNEDDIYQALDEGLADIALIGKPLSISRQSNYLQTPSYMDVTSRLIYRHGQGKPASFEDLAGKKVFVQNNEQNREKFQFLNTHYNDLIWEFSDRPTNELLGMINTGTIDYAIIDSHDYLSKRSLFTRTRIAFDIYYPEPITLAISSHTDIALRDSLNLFFDKTKQDGTITNLIERFYGHADDFNPRGSTSFFHRVRTRLPQYHEIIERIASEYEIDWRLLAAISYQESHWNPLATSPTGVRGMMMLTQGTAKDMSVENRLDVVESLRGGAKYFKEVKRRLPTTIQEPDRTWFALAAYNIGLGHVLDARNITVFHDGNPDNWVDVKKYLPLLEKKDWYQHTQYGYARGREPVGYVQNIRQYRNLLEWRFPFQSDEIKSSHIALNVKKLDQAIKEAKVKNSQPEPVRLKLSSLFL